MARKGYLMQEARQFSTVLDGKTILIETGKMAQLAGGAVTVRQGDTVLLATATMSSTPREGIDFFPLVVDYEERLYAGGRIPGSFFRREGRPSEQAILTARLVDRPIRPLFPKDMRNDVQVILYSLSSDGETQIDTLGILGASAALVISDVPFAGPVGGVRVARLDGRFIFNPTYQQTEASDLDLRLAGMRDAIMMVECGADEVAEDVMVEAIEAGHRAILPLIEVQEQMQAELGKPKRSYPSMGLPEGAVEAVRQAVRAPLAEQLTKPMSKTDANRGADELLEKAVEELVLEGGQYSEADIREAFHEVHYETMRAQILSGGLRRDGRQADEIRPISVEVDESPCAHGSGLFTRGETQVLTLATLGTPRERQELDILSPLEEKRYMHHYNFPPFCVGEVRPLRGASRREIGHGALAERALLPVLPTQEEFPYTLRLVSEVLSSNGSSSMASVCGSTLALMDTGVPIKSPVAGIAMGLVMKDAHYVILTDILGMEDHLGDMDFKVAGTRQGITALQMDIKIKGINAQILSEALAKARQARFKVLDAIEAVIAEPRPELKPHAPRMTVIKVDPLKIGAVIGPGGKMVRKIQEETDTRVDIEDDGTIYIAATDGPSADRARQMIEALTEEAVVGNIYTGKVVRITNYGAFVEILPNVDGMVHISQLSSERVERVEDVAQVGDEITVMVTAIDPEGKIRLSRTAVLEGWTPEEALERDRRPSRGSSGGRGGGRSHDRRSSSGGRSSNSGSNRRQ
jgi:polyribonucleotide nucleotidyltransferase